MKGQAGSMEIGTNWSGRLVLYCSFSKYNNQKSPNKITKPNGEVQLSMNKTREWRKGQQGRKTKHVGSNDMGEYILPLN